MKKGSMAFSKERMYITFVATATPGTTLKPRIGVLGQEASPYVPSAVASSLAGRVSPDVSEHDFPIGAGHFAVYYGPESR